MLLRLPAQRGAALDFVGSYLAENILRTVLPAKPSWIAKRLAPELGIRRPAAGEGGTKPAPLAA